MCRSAQFETYLGIPVVICSNPMLQLIQRIRLVAQTDAVVLITGESGSGKEIVARAVHHYSLRCAKPWVDVNCAALPDHLVESELFGYEKGAFSGAESPKQGLFELAHTGTIYLDEVGELDAKAQAKLLRVLDGVPYYRLGGVRKIAVDTRVIAATNQDIEQAVRSGRFRSDLYHRISEVRIHVPPLRERRDDIVPIAQFFLKKHAPERAFSEDALAALSGYPWPGNIRELRNVVKSAAVFAENSVIRSRDLSLNSTSVALANLSAAVSETWNLEELERQTILKALKETGGHQGKAAEMLGISVRTLGRKLVLYEMPEAAPCPAAGSFHD